MPVHGGEVFITAPASGTDVLAGRPFSVAGTATPGDFVKPNGTFEAELPPTGVTVSIDGGPSLPASEDSPDWANWSAIVQLPSPGSHTIVAVAERTGAWRSQESITVNAMIPRLTIMGIERTQSIQFFMFNGQGSGTGPDNSVPLVAQKSTVLRVYVDSSTPTGTSPASAVSGTLTLTPGPTINPANGPIAATPSTGINRGSANATLNFLLPASLCTGTRTCTVGVFDPQRPGPRLIESQLAISLAFGSVPRLRVHGVLVRVTGPGPSLPAPTDVALGLTLGTLLRIGPLSGMDYTGYTTIDFNGNLTAPPATPGGCGPGWDQLLNQLRALRDASGTTDIYVGILDLGVPVGSVLGCGGGGLAAGREQDGFTMAHEVGHALGRNHAPCPMGIGSVDPSYPACGMFPSGSICEFGVNLATWGILAPQTTFDVMSSCAPRWISPYTYAGILSAITTSAAATTGPSGAAEMQAVSGEYLYLNFRLYRDGRVELLPSFQLYGPPPAIQTGRPSPVECELVSAEDRIIASRRCVLEWNQSADDPYVEYHTVLPWDPDVEKVAFRRDGRIVHTHPVEETAPEIGIEAPEGVDEAAGSIRVEWRAAEAPPETRYILRYSHDDGESWRAVAAHLTEPHHMLDLSLLPGGERCRLQAVASVGIRTAVTQTPPFAVPVKPARARIFSPAETISVEQGQPVALTGIGFSPDSGTSELEDTEWSSDRDGPLGIGHDVIVTDLSVGRHHVQLTVPDGLGGNAVATTVVEVTPRGHADSTLAI
jgi:hypothetical protein